MDFFPHKVKEKSDKSYESSSKFKLSYWDPQPKQFLRFWNTYLLAWEAMSCHAL